MSRCLVVGGGASGMIAAITAAGKGHEVVLFEKNSCLGKKLLATGNGKCNLLNADRNKAHYHSKNLNKAFTILNKKSNRDILEFFAGIGILCYERDGYYYPMSNQAAVVVKQLSSALSIYGVKVCTGIKVTDIKRVQDGYLIVTDKGNYNFGSVILSAGTMAGLSEKDEYNGIQLIKALGMKADFRPALTAFLSDEKICSYWAGVRCRGCIKLMDEEKIIRQDTGELMLTKDGISGIPVFQLSIDYNKGNHAVIDFLPDMDERKVFEYLSGLVCQQERLLKEVLYSMLPVKLSDSLVTEMTFKLKELKGCRSHELLLGDIKGKELLSVIRFIKNFRLELGGTRGYKESQAAANGISLDEIDDNCMVKSLPGLYITGEMLDMTGDCGGYNLQWAWTTGMLAGLAIEEKA